MENAFSQYVNLEGRRHTAISEQCRERGGNGSVASPRLPFRNGNCPKTRRVTTQSLHTDAFGKYLLEFFCCCVNVFLI